MRDLGKMTDNSTPHACPTSDAANQAGSFHVSMKPPLSFEKQLDLMVQRGLVVDDRELAIKRLSETNYYRLRGYWLTYEDNGRFLPGTTFENVWDTYALDSELRDWAWKAIAPVEIKARTLLAYHLSTECGPTAHEDVRYFRSTLAHAKSMESLTRERNRALKDGVPCVVHNVEKYGDLPIWAAVEIMSMGTVSQLYGNLDPSRSDVAKLVARGFNIKPFMLRSWLRHLTYVRNICGHHSRLYNRVMTTRAALLRADSRYDGDKEFPTIVVLRRIYERSWPDAWDGMVGELANVVGRHAGVDLSPMGFPDDWEKAVRR